MTPESIAAYGFALILLLVALLRTRTSVRMRDNSGVVVTGNNSGSISQNKTEAAPPPSSSEDGSPHGDHVGWIIGIAGVLIAAAQLVHDLLK